MLASTTLPDNAGYVAAAYLVFLALLLIYVGIMAYKLADRALAPSDRPATDARDREETPA
jgi:hypothetical protein